MEFILMNPEKLKVILAPEDLEDLDISYEMLDYSDPHTRDILIHLLEQGKAAAGFRPHNAKLYIEVFPTEDDGCVLYFTCLGTACRSCSGMAATLTPTAVVFAFDDADTLTQAAVGVFDRYSHRIYKSSLYRMEAGYRLIIHPLDYTDRLSVLFLSEFGEKVGEGPVLAAYIEEHGVPLIEDNALDTIARYFS